MYLFFSIYFLIRWRLITYNIVVGFVIHWHESAMDLHVFPIPITPPTSLSTWSLWVFPVHQAQALVSCIPPGLVICFTLDNIHVSMLFSRNIPPSPSPTESKSLFCTSWHMYLKGYCGDWEDACKELLSHVWLFVTPWTCSLPGSSVHGTLQARLLEWVAISS